MQGGGPYGPLGESFESADVDALASASISVVEGKAKGNVESVAEMIQSVTGGDLFPIRTVQKYPADYDELITLGGEERNADARPELLDGVEDMAEYDVVFLGYPNWWNDMPMAVYSFLEEYDFSGKVIVPFVVSAGSGFSRTISSLEDMFPEAVIVEEGLHIPMRDAADSEERIREWISGLELDAGDERSAE